MERKRLRHVALGTVFSFLGLVLLVIPAGAGEEEPGAATIVEHAKPLPPSPRGMLGTAGYSVSEKEAPFYAKLTPKERMAGSGLTGYEITGKKGAFVGWCGIVRRIEEDPARKETRLLVEMKYFDGLRDLHIMLVSIHGAGDFRAVLRGTKLRLERLSLVRVYGLVEGEENEVPTLRVDYARHWKWGLFTFMSYGKPGGNPLWRDLCKVKDMRRVYHPRPDRRFYEDRLGPLVPSLYERLEGRKGLEAVVGEIVERLKQRKVVTADEGAELVSPLVATIGALAGGPRAPGGPGAARKILALPEAEWKALLKDLAAVTTERVSAEIATLLERLMRDLRAKTTEGD